MMLFSCLRCLSSSVTLAILASVAIGSSLMPAAAQTYEPPIDIGLPGRREGGGTRGGCVSATPPLTALAPEENFGYTTSPYPTWYWYVPNISAETAEFVLYNEDNEEVYQSTFTLEGNTGIISLSLPTYADLPPLQIGQRYRWEFSLICDPTVPSGLVFVDGWIERIEPSAELQSQLEAATPLEQARLYAEAGVWFDALETLAALRRSEPQQRRYLLGWQQLLRSVALGAIANEPLRPCCEGETTTESSLAPAEESATTPGSTGSRWPSLIHQYSLPRSR